MSPWCTIFFLKSIFKNFENRVDQDQLASGYASCLGSTPFYNQMMNPFIKALFILMDYLIHIDSISMELSILYLQGLLVNLFL